jgi:hypothetical protein
MVLMHLLFIRTLVDVTYLGRVYCVESLRVDKAAVNSMIKLPKWYCFFLHHLRAF